jgi:hypothetical protein
VSIFISIVAYRDPLVGFTISRALATASSRNGLRFGVVDQSPATMPPIARPPRHLRYMRIDPVYARGPCWARALAMSLYDGEDWILQIDSHMDFDPGWDDVLIGQARLLERGRKGIVLSTYPPAFVFENGEPVRKLVTRNVLACVLTPQAAFAPDHLALPFEAYPVEVAAPWPGFHVGAGCLFTHGRFALEFPYDPAIYFHGEEQSLFLRLFTHGWDVFHPVATPLYHLYADKPTGTERRPLHTDPEDEAPRSLKFAELEARSRRRLRDLVAGRALGAYGLGQDRSLDDVAAFCGIDYRERRIEPRAYRPLPAPGAA